MGGRLALLLATGYLLVADSEPESIPPQSCVHAAETLTWAVSGSCGPAGNVVIESLENECGISVSGAAAVGLPSAGRFDDFEGKRQVSLLTSAWTLSGDIDLSTPDAGAGGQAGADGGILRPDASPVQPGDAAAGGSANDDAAIYVPPPATGEPSSLTLRTCIPAAGTGTMPRNLTCQDDARPASGCIAQLSP